MNDHELDRLVATATHVRDSWVDGFDLRAAEDELMEEIMATTDSDAPELAGVEPPPSGPAPFASRPGRFKLAVAIGIAAALIVGVVVTRSMSGGDADEQERDVTTASRPDIAPLIADPIPEGYEVTSIYPEEGLVPEPQPSDDDEIDTRLYGDRTPTAVTNDVVIRVAASAPEGEVLGEPVRVRGQDGTLCTPEPETEDGETIPTRQCDFGNNMTGVSWTDESGLYISVESRTFDADQVLAMAEGVVVDGSTVELGDVPAGVTKPPELAALDSDWSWAYMVDYRAPDGQATFSVLTRPMDAAESAYTLWLAGPRDAAQVNGHGASVDYLGDAYAVTWEPAPGQIVEVLAQAPGIEEATALEIAETVRPATDTDWTALQDEVAGRPPPDDHVGLEPPPEDAVYRELANGEEIWAYLKDGELCYQNQHADSSGGSELCGGDPTGSALGVSPSSNEDGLVSTVPSVVGIAPAGTESIEGGEVTFGQELEGGWIYIWESDVEGEMPPDTLTFLDAEGNEIETVDVLTF